MTVINLRKYYYPIYTKDTFMEVPDEVAEALVEGQREGRREDGKKYYYGVLSLEASEGLENHTAFLPLSAEEEMFRNEEIRAGTTAEELLLKHLEEALSQLTPTQARRLHARFVQKKRIWEISRDEGVSGSCASDSICSAIRKLRKIFKKNGWMNKED